jgi:hypothetical protein
LISKDAAEVVVSKGSRAQGRTLDDASLGDVFGIDIAQGQPPAAARPVGKQRAKREVAAAAKPPRSSRSKKAAAPAPQQDPAAPASAENKPARTRRKTRAK